MEDNHVSSLEVLASMTKKFVQRRNDGIVGNMARGYLDEQSVTYFGHSGASFSEKYFSRGEGKFSKTFGWMIGVGQDYLSVIGLYNLTINDKIDPENQIYASLIGLKVATQIGAYAVRHYRAEKARLKKAKAEKPMTHEEVRKTVFEETGEVIP